MAYSGLYKPVNPKKYRGNPTRIIYRSMWVTKSGKYEKYVIEVKPKRQTQKPNEKPKRKTAAWKREVLTYIKNRAKWDAAEDFCEDRQMKFKILTEDHLKV
jgi:hypothetical protein